MKSQLPTQRRTGSAEGPVPIEKAPSPASGHRKISAPSLDGAATLRRALRLGLRPSSLRTDASEPAVPWVDPEVGAVQRAPEIAATDKEMGKRVAEKVEVLNGPSTATKGVHYAHNYQRMALEYKKDPVKNAGFKGYADFWKEEYWNGYADPVYFDQVGFMSWKLKSMASASEAIKAWLAGPTIAECASALVAIETDTLRAAIGDDKFDALYSEWPKAPAKRGLLTISTSAWKSSVGQYMHATDEVLWASFGLDKPNSRSVEKGEWYYFYNHPKYLLKHPGGAFQGENAICMDATPGSQKWSGFGVLTVSETEMMNAMARAYNAPRTERDYDILLDAFAKAQHQKKNGANTYKSLYLSLPDPGVIPDDYREDKGIFPTAPIDAAAILGAAEHTIGTTSRKGGFVSGSGKRLNAKAVAATRNS